MLIETIRTREIPANTPEVLSPVQLKERALLRGEVIDVKDGGIAVKTEPKGRTPKAKGIVESDAVVGKVDFGSVNNPVTKDDFLILKDEQDREFRRSGHNYFNTYYAQYKDTAVPVRLKTTSAWTSLFASNLLLTNGQREQAGLEIDRDYSISIAHTPELKTGAAVWTEFREDGDIDIRIKGTEYAGETKKSVFNALNFISLENGDLSLHCSANVGERGDTALFLGMSGTGKTTLSADEKRKFLGDDEHIWSEQGVNNIEGGSYAKLIKLREDKEPQIYKGVFHGLSVMENVEIDGEGRPIFEFGEENMRGAYTLEALDNVYEKRIAGHPENIVLLTADASGGMPAVARLTPEQAVYYFLSGYTSLIPGTVADIKEVKATFQACFGEPFLPGHPTKYAKLFAEMVSTYTPDVYLVNTGWPGGRGNEAQEKNKRMDIDLTRAVIDVIHSGELKKTSMHKDGLGLYVPDGVAGFDPKLIRAENAFGDYAEYASVARELAGKFDENFAKYRGQVPQDIFSAGPRFA